MQNQHEILTTNNTNATNKKKSANRPPKVQNFEEANASSRWSLQSFLDLMSRFEYNSDSKNYCLQSDSNNLDEIYLNISQQISSLLSNEDIQQLESEDRTPIFREGPVISIEEDVYTLLMTEIDAFPKANQNCVPCKSRIFIKMPDNESCIHIPEIGTPVATLLGEFNRNKTTGVRFLPALLEATRLSSDNKVKTYTLRAIKISSDGFTEWCKQNLLDERSSLIVYDDDIIKNSYGYESLSFDEKNKSDKRHSRPIRKKITPKRTKTNHQKRTLDLGSFGVFTYDEDCNSYKISKETKDIHRLASEYKTTASEYLPDDENISFEIDDATNTLSLSSAAANLIHKEFILNKKPPIEYQNWIFSQRGTDYVHITPWGCQTLVAVKTIKRQFKNSIAPSVSSIRILRDGKTYRKRIIRLSQFDYNEWNKHFKIENPTLVSLEEQANLQGYQLTGEGESVTEKEIPVSDNNNDNQISIESNEIDLSNNQERFIAPTNDSLNQNNNNNQPSAEFYPQPLSQTPTLPPQSIYEELDAVVHGCVEKLVRILLPVAIENLVDQIYEQVIGLLMTSREFPEPVVQQALDNFFQHPAQQIIPNVIFGHMKDVVIQQVRNSLNQRLNQVLNQAYSHSQQTMHPPMQQTVSQPTPTTPIPREQQYQPSSFLSASDNNQNSSANTTFFTRLPPNTNRQVNFFPQDNNNLGYEENPLPPEGPNQ